MLRELHIKNYVLIDSLEITFPAGLVIITGQTGAGKSIILGALSLLTGAKADVSMIGGSSDKCFIEAVFDVEDEVVKSIIDKNDIDWNNGCLTISRILNPTGRHRAFINDIPVNIDVLKELSIRLLDIHTQDGTMLLADKEFQLRLLDLYAGNEALRGEYAVLWKKYKHNLSEYTRLKENLTKIEEDREYNSLLLSRLDAAKLRAGELEELEETQKRLANAENIKLGLSKVLNNFNPQSDELPNIDYLLKDSVRQIEKLSTYISHADNLCARIESCRLELSDILSEVDDLEQGIEVDPRGLEKLEQRMSLLYDLMNIHKCKNIEELIQIRDDLSGNLQSSNDLAMQIEELGELIDNQKIRLNEIADKLHEARLKSAVSFAKVITDNLKFLELEHSVFEVALDASELSEFGKDTVAYMFSSTGFDPKEIAKCASGGEKSRIMLCLKFLMASYCQMPTMIFDEIDTGVSGSVADKMGTMICKMGDKMQIFAITHLPQVAAKGLEHFVVEKNIIDGKADSTIKSIKGKERIYEIARLLSGSTITEEAVANAKSLLSCHI